HDWQRALPRVISVRGGRPHELRSFTAIDEDTVHASTASCHHGARLPEPLPVDLRASYTDEHVYLRLSWADATPDRTMQQWVHDGERWQNTAALEDGFGLLWDARGSFSQFTCAYACHINDFGVSRANFHATNRMRLNDEQTWLDLWNWKAARTAPLGFADDRYLDHTGMHGDLPGDLFRANSRADRNPDAGIEPFTEQDQPIYDADRQPAGHGFRSPGTTAPGFLVDRPQGHRADVLAITSYRDGRWTVVLRRALQTGDPRDVVFVPGDRVGVAFGLALMDHTRYEHYASRTMERLVLLAPEAGRGGPGTPEADQLFTGQVRLAQRD
ncbi:MAG: ethylbenzene dehydrogenase-related protein, partial [Candidatus Competibacterales bacterium]|nr:ethylbenzene dehydrogenase-related protein [Candidatus Competibacterales bacterium]